MIDPTLYTGIQFGKGNISLPVEGDITLQAVSKVDGIAPLKEAMLGIDDKAQPGCPLCRRLHLGLASMGGQTQLGQSVRDGSFPLS
jgi:hypothetical protein